MKNPISRASLNVIFIELKLPAAIIVIVSGGRRKKRASRVFFIKIGVSSCVYTSEKNLI